MRRHGMEYLKRNADPCSQKLWLPARICWHDNQEARMLREAKDRVWQL
jgi:hypothetical protein